MTIKFQCLGKRSSSTRTLVSTSFRYDMLNTRREGWRAAHRDDLKAWTHFIGPETDPLLRLELCAAWPFFPEGAIVDNSVYSDLDVMKAPRWILRADWSSESLWFDTPVASATCRLIAQRRTLEDKKCVSYFNFLLPPSSSSLPFFSFHSLLPSSPLFSLLSLFSSLSF